MQANPGIGQQDIYYTDAETWQEEMWAKSEIFMLTGSQSLLGSFYSDLITKNISIPTWSKPQILSFVSMYNSSEVSGVVKNRIKIIVENYATELKQIVDKSGYGSAISKYGWGWGTNTFMANAGATFIYAHIITGDEVWLKYAAQQLDYLMGRNSLDYSFITGYGSNSCKQPFHWITKTYGIIPEGLIGQGAIGAHLVENTNVDNIVKELMRAEFPSAKIYRDSVDSWNSNEVGIYTVSSLAFLTGYLALHKRDVNITSIPILQKNNNLELEISNKNGSLFCANCIGKTKVDLYSLNGQLLLKEVVNATHPNFELTNYSVFVRNNPLIIFNVIDEIGKSKKGKLMFIQVPL